MDLEILKGLKITDDKEKITSNQTQVTEQPKQPEHLFDKLSNAFNGAEHKVPPPVAAPLAEPEHQGLLDKLSHAVGGYSEPPKPPIHPVEPKHDDFLTRASHLFGEKPEPTPPPLPSNPNHGNLLDKITDVLGGDRHETAQSPTPPPPEHKNIFEKIGDALSGDKDTPPPPLPHPASKSEGLSDKIQAALHGGEQETVSQTENKDKKDIFDKLGLGHQPEPVPPKEESLLEKIGSTFNHDEPPKEPTFGEKIGSKLGLGKTEREEDHLDKTIDFIQEHVMQHGDQHNEGRFEQWKDDRIANTIRSQYQHATGHEFPGLKEKK
ncbi:hypothetical protein E1B28_002306 [Marasmius oreades]|uniref:Uncharacterized protein n=1 Tax=Marasmius oreades TaxID=181124 RepID=A0A9P7ULG1_9AGAR|nr:uncharacterized protein E1B28_002306 [Marasmius oreades]KAG7086345.1 hypothetical protein E1B28_002306 [Marasmius oreades]